MKKHFQYLWYLLRHKWFVFIAGLNLNVPLWRLLVHDWTKFLPREWFPYVDNFYGDKKDPDAYDRAWNHHQKHNPHHWQYWLLTRDNPRSNKHQFVVAAPAGDWIPPYVIQEHCPYRYGNDLSWFQHKGKYQMTGTAEAPTYVRNVCWIELNKQISQEVEGPEDLNDMFDRADMIAAALNRAQPLEMPEVFVREMVADWMGAGRAITGGWEVRKWYVKNKSNMHLHPNTRKLVEELLGVSP